MKERKLPDLKSHVDLFSEVSRTYKPGAPLDSEDLTAKTTKTLPELVFQAASYVYVSGINAQISPSSRFPFSNILAY